MINLFLTFSKLQKEEGMAFWPMQLYQDTFNYLIFYPTQLDSIDLGDSKNSKAYSYKSG